MGSRLEAKSGAVSKRIQQHQFDDENGEEYEPSKFGGFTDYLRRKKIKLQNLDAELRASAESKSHPAIFRGIVAHVNGYTQPSLSDLHTMIVSYGGGFMQYLDGKTAVTHIIASNLTPKKKVDFAKYRIVKPAWIVDSISAGRLLPWDTYRVVDEGSAQRLLGFREGQVVSNVNTNHSGYKAQTEHSWYTKQVEDYAGKIASQVHNPEDLAVQPGGSQNEDPKGNATKSQDVIHSGSELPRVHEAASPSGNEDQIEDDTNARESSPSDTALLLNHPVEPDVRNEDIPNWETLQNSNSKNVAEMTPEEHNALLLADPRVRKSTVVNPEFLKQYYEESRLHHLSAWKAALKTKLQALAAERSSSQKARDKTAPGSRRYIMHVDFDSFFAAVSLRKYPKMVDKPIAVAHGNGGGAEIASCNYPAREFGIKNGMWMKQAQKLCPGLKVLPYDFKAYEEASRKFYDAIIATGGLVQSVSIDEALVDISAECLAAGGHDGRGIHEGSIWREQEKADSIAVTLRDKIKQETGCAVSIGVGGNILQAKVALRKAKPAGQFQLKPEEVLDFMGELTMQDLPGVAWSIGGRLEEIGVKFVKDVRQLSKERVSSILGPKTGEKVWNYARGIDKTEVGDQIVRKSVSAEVNWGIRFATQQQADEFIQSLANELHNRLLAEGVKGRQLTMKIMRRSADAPLDPPKHLGHGKCDTFNKSVTLGVATNEANIIGKEALAILKGFGFTPGGLRGLALQMQKLDPVKRDGESVAQSSQRLLRFQARTNVIQKHDSTEDHDEIESPQKPQIKAADHVAALFSDQNAESPTKNQPPLNVSGTQFILPSQVDPEVLQSLPADIISRFRRPSTLFSAAKSQKAHDSIVPALPSTYLPSHSQLDQETLNALPDEVRQEIIAHYQKSPRKGQNQALLPQSPRTNRVVKLPKKLTTPTKRRTRLTTNGMKNVAASASGLMQSNFVPTRNTTLIKSEVAAAEPDSVPAQVSSEFLEALPEDIRQEVLAQARQDRLQQKGGINVLNQKRKKPPGPSIQPGQRLLTLPPRPAKPSFTADKLTELSQLRNVITTWVQEFSDEAPFAEDVAALSKYVRAVVMDERDMRKAAALSEWLAWTIEDSHLRSQSEWNDVHCQIQSVLQQALRDRGVGPAKLIIT